MRMDGHMNNIPRLGISTIRSFPPITGRRWPGKVRGMPESRLRGVCAADMMLVLKKPYGRKFI
jgi:hypothetical protein